MTADDVEAMLAAGADLVQLHTGYLYEGPRLLKEICHRLAPVEATAEVPTEEQHPAEEPQQTTTENNQEERVVRHALSI